MADIAIFRINYKSDFILTLQSDAGWMTPFCIKFWTGAPSQAYFAGYDGTTYTHCAPVDGDPTKLSVQFDDHHLPIGDMKFQIGYHFTVADFPTSIEDEVINQAAVIIDNDGEQQQVMLDFNGETAPEIAFAMPAYANEAQRIANEQARIAAEEQRVSNEQQRISNEEGRISAEESRQENEQQRIHNEETRIAEFASLKAEAIAATGAANDAATFANEKAQLAADKAALAQTAATLANDKAQLAADKASLAQAAATLANDKAALAQQKADYAQAKAEYAQAQGDYAKAQSDIALADHERAETDHERAEADHDTATDDHTTATSDHTQAESDHTRAEADHTTAASDHTQASSDHSTATSDHTQAGQDHTRAESDHTTAAADHTRAESDHAAVEVYVDSLGAFDISSYHATGGELAKYADLTAALGTDGANIPEGIRKGGMSVKYVCTSDNKYVHYRLMSTAWSNVVGDWQGIDDKLNGSNNLVKNWAIYTAIPSVEDSSEDDDLDFADEQGNVLAKFAGGHIKTKNFDSKNVSDIELIENYGTDEGTLDFADNNGYIVVRFENNRIVHRTPLYGKRLSVLGDSISSYQDISPSGTGYASFYPKGDVSSFKQMWWQLVADYYGMEIVKINANAGSCVTENVYPSRISCSSDERTSGLNEGNKTPDLIICECGINDFYLNAPIGTYKGDVPLDLTDVTTFRGAYANMLRKLQYNYPFAKIYCCVPAINWHSGYIDDVTPINSNNVPFKDYVSAIKEITELFGASIIRLDKCGITMQNAESYVVDSPTLASFHPNIKGMILYSKEIIKSIKTY